MAYKRLFCFVEGGDDHRFVDRVIKPRFQTDYDDVSIVMWAQQKTDKVKNFIKSIESMGADYIFFCDLDTAICPVLKIESITERFEIIDGQRIQVVIQEIEGWYVAGSCLSDDFDANTVVKEDIEDVIEETLSREAFMLELLNDYDFDKARENSHSLGRFVDKFLCC